MPHAVQMNWSRGLLALGVSLTDGEALAAGGDATSGRVLGERLEGPAPPSPAPAPAAAVAAAGLLLPVDL